MKTFIIHVKKPGCITTYTGRGLGGTLWTNYKNDATKFDAPTKFHCLQSLSPNFGKCIANEI